MTPSVVECAEFRSRYADLREGEEGVTLVFRPDEPITLGSSRRTKEVCSRVSGLLRRVKPRNLVVDEASVQAHFPPSKLPLLPSVLAKLDRCVDSYRKGLLHPRMVDEILGITPMERSRWIKDGRLPISGSGSFRRGRQSIHFPLHPVGKIAALARSSDLIAAWREQDASKGAA